jgi:hypothetical protein
MAAPETRVKSAGLQKKELAKKEHDRYDSRHENLLLSSASRILRSRADDNQKRLNPINDKDHTS